MQRLVRASEPVGTLRARSRSPSEPSTPTDAHQDPPARVHMFAVIHARSYPTRCTKFMATHLQVVRPCEELVLRAGHDGLVIVLPQQGDLLRAQPSMHG